MSFKKSVLAFILVYIQAVSLMAAPQALPYSRSIAEASDLDTKAQESQSLVMNIDGPQGNTQFSYTEVPLESPKQLGDLLQREETKNADVLLSTDTPEVYEAVAETIQKTSAHSERQFRFMPIGKLAAAGEKLANSWATYKKNVSDTFKYDKLGLSIVLITTSYDSFIWIHSASLDVYQKSAMVMMNVIFAAAFGLDRDTWSRMTTPLRHKILNSLDKLSNKIRGGVETQTMYARKVLASQFLANLTFSIGFQFLRSSIMSYHELASTVMSSHFWATSIKVALITTAASFAWSELMAAANSEKYPVAKNALKRLADVRNIVMSQLASMGMVLQPGVYGYSPIVAIVTSGAIGLLALLKSNKVIQWLETNKVTNILFRNQRKLENFVNDAAATLRENAEENFLKENARTAGGGAGMCSALFN